MDNRERNLWIGIRRAIILILGVIENYLDMPHSIIPKKKK